MLISEYGKIYNVGYKEVSTIFFGKVFVQEKVDGSQFSFMRKGDDVIFRSKGRHIDINNGGMFKNGINSINEIKMFLEDGYIYRGEYLQRPRHNVLSYDRIPNHHVIIYDIQDENHRYLLPSEVEEILDGQLEYAPIFYSGLVKNTSELNSYLDNISILGKSKIEGVVIKNYETKLRAKLVRDEFKEISRSKKTMRCQATDFASVLAEELRTEARWLKAFNRLKEDNELNHNNSDIGKLIKSVFIDLESEVVDYCKDSLWKHYKSSILKGSVKGMAEWYKNKLGGF